jgi:glycosyltransferase involved in cell wall biosynthesis
MLKHVFDEKINHPNIQFICHLAVDAEPWHLGTVAPIKNADHIVALTEFGKGVLEPLLNRSVDYIWHGVDTDNLYPLSPQERHQLRIDSSKGVFDKDTFVAGFVGKDQYRKQNDKIWEYTHYMRYGDYITCEDCGRVTLMEWDPSKGQVKDPLHLTTYDRGYNYSHCSYCGSSKVVKGQPNEKFYTYLHMPYRESDAWNPDQLNAIWRVQDRVFNTKNLTPNRGVDKEDMNNIYNLFDMLYFPSGGEGFGMPVLESMACGVPVMYSNYSAHAEVAGDAGIPLKCSYVTEMMSCYNRARVDTAHAVEMTNKILKNRKLVKPLINRGLKIAKDNTWEIIGNKWLKYIDNVSEKCSKAIGVIV